MTVIANLPEESFEGKIDRAIEAVSFTVGEEIKDNICNKFLIKKRKN